MDKNQWMKQARNRIGQTGWILLIYCGILNVAVMLVYLLDIAFYMIGQSITTGGLDLSALTQHMLDAVSSNGWGYILAILIGTLIAVLWKKPRFWREEVFRTNAPMTVGVFIQLLCVFISVQTVSELLTPMQEWLFNQFGFSVTVALEAATMTGTSVSMFLYITILGPVSEELLFRGLLLRLLKPYGKQFAILVSALLFGLYHGNVVQIPFTFLVGIVLGYVTVEYSIIWAMVLHIFNNLVLADLMGRLAELLPGAAGDWMYTVILLAVTAAALVILICRRREVKTYMTQDRLDGPSMKAMITAPGVLVFMILMLLSSLLTLTPI